MALSLPRLSYHTVHTSADNSHNQMTPHLNFLLTRDLRKSDLALQTGGFQGLFTNSPPSFSVQSFSAKSWCERILPMLDGIQGFCGTPRTSSLRWGYIILFFVWAFRLKTVPISAASPLRRYDSCVTFFAQRAPITTVARVKKTFMIMRLDFNETKQKSKWGKLGCAAVQLLGYEPVSESSLWFNPISESEQEGSGGKYSRCAVVSWNVALFSSCSSQIPTPSYASYVLIAGSPPMAGCGMHCGCFAKSKVFVDKPRRVLFSTHSTYRFSPNYYHYIVSNSYL